MVWQSSSWVLAVYDELPDSFPTALVCVQEFTIIAGADSPGLDTPALGCKVGLVYNFCFGAIVLINHGESVNNYKLLRNILCIIDDYKQNAQFPQYLCKFVYCTYNILGFVFCTHNILGVCFSFIAPLCSAIL